MQTSRRSFVAAMAAAFSTTVMAGGIVLRRPQVKWDYFTDLDAVRFDLATPWRVGQSTVATDGRILFSAYGYADCATAESSKRPDLSILPWDQFDSAGWSDSSLIGKSGDIAVETGCPDCMGTGFIGNTHKVLADCEFGDKWRIERWRGDAPCTRCEGLGWCDRADNAAPLADAGGVSFNPAYIARIKSMGDFDWKIDNVLNTAKQKIDVMMFRNDLGRGLLCSTLTNKISCTTG